MRRKPFCSNPASPPHLAPLLEHACGLLHEMNVNRLGEQGPNHRSRFSRRPRRQMVLFQQHDMPRSSLGQMKGETHPLTPPPPMMTTSADDFMI